MRMRPAHVAAAALALAATGGCARSAEERQLDQMRDEIDRIQELRDREDQATIGPDPDSAGPRPASRATLAGPVRDLPADVVRVGEGEGDSRDDAADTEDSTPRPSIRVIGAARSPGRGGWRGQEVEQTLQDDGSGSARPAALDPEAKRAYDAALMLVNARQFDKALDALAAFLVKWPEHPYADNAMYWRAECYYARGDYARAAEQFEGVAARFPAGNKAPDALLKLGLSQQKLGNAAKARDTFQRLVQLYPQSDAARRVPAAAAPATPPPAAAPEDRR
ncbi:MAG TPA: tol-pal system protein YbgF [Polyangiaceae bacterium]|nr:tol-pal system protein YbgF [Polyangiaceae bacterium]